MIRQPAVAGKFYPGNPQELSDEIAEYLEKAPDAVIKNLKGIIVPHAGYVYSGPIAAYSYKLLTHLPDKKYNVFIIGPAHFQNTKANIGNYEEFETPLGKVKVNQQICEELLKNEQMEFSDETHAPEHNLEVQIPFLQTILDDFEIIPILLRDVDPQEISHILNPYFQKEDSLFVISSDLSHYEPYETANQLDKNSLDIVTSLNTKKEEEINACGNMALRTAMHLAIENSCKIQLLDYRNSGDTAGDKSGVVGYAALAITK